MSVAQEAAVRARLLVVDDDEGVLNFLRRVLTSEGFEVRDAAGHALRDRAASGPACCSACRGQCAGEGGLDGGRTHPDRGR